MRSSISETVPSDTGRADGRVVGLMPHPEHATEPGFGPDTAEAMRSGGVELAVETLIQQSVEQAMTTLDAATLNPAAASGFG